MAYPKHLTGIRESDRQESRPGSRRPLSDLEGQTVFLSLRDGRLSVGQPTWTCRMLTIVVGHHRQNRMADPRLEALRRYSVLYRLDGPRIGAAELGLLNSAGFSLSQIGDVQDQIDHLTNRRWDRSRTGFGLLTAAGTLLAMTLLIGWLSISLGDRLIACIVVGLAAVTLAPLICGRSHHHSERRTGERR